MSPIDTPKELYSYDAIGNPTTYRGAALTWSGRRHPKCLRPMGRIQLRLPHSSSSRMTNSDSIGVCKA